MSSTSSFGLSRRRIQMPVEPRITCGWGRYPTVTAAVHQARWLKDLQNPPTDPRPTLAQGNLRSYGDAGLSPCVLSTRRLNRFLAFDETTGHLEAEAGVTLDEILRLIVPRGWFLPVTPGTKFPTLAGCVAADVHGKNHHADGSLFRHIESLILVTAAGETLRCGPAQNPRLFEATCGGMGLTGFIYSIRLRLLAVESSQLNTVTVRSGDLQETCDLLQETQSEHRYSVAWVDLLSRRRRGRGLVMLGDHADGATTRVHPSGGLPVPRLPSGLLSPWPLQLGNWLYYRRQLRRRATALVHYDPYFYPLDGLKDWNRAYGNQGFLQYQFVVPFEGGRACIDTFLDRVGRQASCALAVLKTFGESRTGILGFPMAGWTLALDFPRRRDTIDSLRTATDVIRDAGGRVYLAKDAVLDPAHFEGMYPRLEEFCRIKAQFDPHSQLRSTLSDRLGIT